MKRMNLFIILFVFATILFSSCAVIPTPVGVGIFSDVKYNYAAASVKMDADKFNRIGTSRASNILGIIQTGDISVNAGMRAGNIEKVHHVDMKVTNVLGLFSSKTIMVYGE